MQSNVYWLPRTYEIRLLNCADPPAKHAIAMLLAEKLSHHPHVGEPFDTMFKCTALRIKRTPPNKDWMLAVLSTIDAENVLFSKGYVKPKVDARGKEAEDEFVENNNDFFTGLPATKSSKNINFVTKSAVQQQHRMRVMEYQMQRMQDRLQQ